MRRCVVLSLALALVAVSGCGGPGGAGPAEGVWVGSISTEGNATTVINESGSVWGGPATLVEEASIGVEAGDDAYMFGRVTGIAAARDRIYIADGQVPAIRIYDLAGSFVDNLGDEGSGPGEYRDPAGLGVDAQGRVYTLDMATGRLLMYSAEGEPLATSMPMPCCRNAGRSYVLVAPAGQPYVIGSWRRQQPAAEPDAEEEYAWGIMAFGLDGTAGEVIAEPDLPRTPINMVASDGRLVTMAPAPFQPRPVVSYAPTGTMLSGYSIDYHFEVRHTDGRRMIVERSWEPPPVGAEEAEAARRGATAYMRQRDPEWLWNIEEMPATKPPYFDLAGGINGEAWVIRREAGTPIPDCEFDEADVTEDDMTPCFHEPRIVDAFDPTGRYLGSFELPEDVRLDPRPWIDDGTVIARAEDDAGTIMVKRYRLVLPQRGS